MAVLKSCALRLSMSEWMAVSVLDWSTSNSPTPSCPSPTDSASFRQLSNMASSSDMLVTWETHKHHDILQSTFSQYFQQLWPKPLMKKLPLARTQSSVDKIIKAHHSHIILSIIPKAMRISSKPGRPKLNIWELLYDFYITEVAEVCVCMCAVYKV